jgi:hypothetical protein
VLEFALSDLTAVRALFHSRSNTAFGVLALRQQVGISKRKSSRPDLNRLDRFFWTTLCESGPAGHMRGLPRGGGVNINGPGIQEHELAAPQAELQPATHHMQRLGMLREITGRQRHRLFVYDAYLAILSEGTDPIR